MAHAIRLLTSSLTRPTRLFPRSSSPVTVVAVAVSRFYGSNSGDLQARFKQSVDDSKKLKEDPGNEAKLKLYALFKQASVGPNTTAKPGAFDVVGKYKWQAWTDLGNLTQDEAMQQYVDYVQQLEKEVGTTK